MLPLKYQEWVKKELENLERVGVVQRSLSAYTSPIVMVPIKCPPGSPIDTSFFYN